MAEIEQEKSRGLRFAEQQLLRHGWEQGKGLGRAENGIVEAIKVKVKCDKGGVGHKQGEQFTFHWWDHVFNKASASLQVESDQNGVSVKKTVEEEEEGMISNKKPRKATLDKAKLYGCFVKSATLLSGQEQPEPKASTSDDSSSSSSDDEDQKLDLSSTTKLSDADLMKACGGRTAHKGARHGFTMNAKLARLEQQEAEFMAKYTRKSQSGNSSPDCATPTVQSAAQSPEREEAAAVTESRGKKSKNKKNKKSSKDSHERMTVGNGHLVSRGGETDTKPKKKKRKRDNSDEASEDLTVATVTEEELNPAEHGEAEHSLTTTRKHKKKNRNREVCETTADHAPERAGVPEEKVCPEQQTRKKKKKKSSSERCKDPAVPDGDERCNDAESSQSEPLRDPVPKKTKKREVASAEDPEHEAAGEAGSTGRRTCNEDERTVEGSENKGAVPPKKKKKKKTSKQHKMEQD